MTGSQFAILSFAALFATPLFSNAAAVSCEQLVSGNAPKTSLMTFEGDRQQYKMLTSPDDINGWTSVGVDMRVKDGSNYSKKDSNLKTNSMYRVFNALKTGQAITKDYKLVFFKGNDISEAKKQSEFALADFTAEIQNGLISGEYTPITLLEMSTVLYNRYYVPLSYERADLLYYRSPFIPDMAGTEPGAVRDMERSLFYRTHRIVGSTAVEAIKAIDSSKSDFRTFQNHALRISRLINEVDTRKMGINTGKVIAAIEPNRSVEFQRKAIIEYLAHAKARLIKQLDQHLLSSEELQAIYEYAQTEGRKIISIHDAETQAAFAAYFQDVSDAIRAYRR